MICEELITIGNKKYIKHCSDSEFYISRDGEMYEEAIDPENSDREYVETDVKIPVCEDEVI